MKNLIAIILVGLFVGLAVFYNTCEGDSTVIVSKKHKRVLKSVTSHQSPVSSIQYPVPVSSIKYPVSKVDTFIDKDKNGINDLIKKKNEKNALFRFLNEKASSYVSAQGGSASGEKKKNTKTEEPSSPSARLGETEQVNVESRTDGTEQNKIPSKKAVKVKKTTRK